jgi:hypothetical protein
MAKIINASVFDGCEKESQHIITIIQVSLLDFPNIGKSIMHNRVYTD